jgi:GNAT superfamily N-acetyltransferase
VSGARRLDPSIEVRRARPEDRDAVLALLAETFGAGGLVDDPGFWAWKHERSPFGPSPCLVAEADGRVVALRAFLPWRFRSGEREIRAVRAVDTATHPDWRGRGLFRRLTLRLAEELAAEGVAFVFNTPNRYSLPGYLAMGWRDLGRLPVWVRPRRPLRLARALVAPGASSDEADSPTGDAAGGVSDLLAHPGLPALLDVAADRARTDGRYHTPRTPEYLRWRYAEVPRLIYGARWTLDGPAAGSAAIIVRRKLRRGLRELMVAEVLVDGTGGAREAARLLRGLIDETGADVATALAARDTPEAEALTRAGFLRLPGAGPRLVVRPLTRDEAPEGNGGRDARDPSDRRSFRPGLGDLELF